MKIGEKYKIVNHDYLNSNIVKVIEYYCDRYYICEIVDKSILDNIILISEEYLQPLRSHKLKRLLK